MFINLAIVITVEARERGREQRGLRGSNWSIVSSFWLVCSLPVLCLVPVRLLFLVFCSLFSVNQSISTVVCSSQLYSEGGGASQPRSKQVSEDNSLRGSHVYTYYVEELQSLNFYHHVQCYMWNLTFHINTFWTNESCGVGLLDSTHSMCQLEIQDEVQF